MHDQYFGYDDEDALTMLGGQLAVAMSLMQPQELEPPAPAPVKATAQNDGGPALRLRRFARDNSVFLDDIYLIRGVAGAILWKLVSEFLRSGRREFTNRELRLAPELRLPDVQDNLEVRLLLLQRRLAEQGAPLRLEKAGRGRMRLNVESAVVLETGRLTIKIAVGDRRRVRDRGASRALPVYMRPRTNYPREAR